MRNGDFSIEIVPEGKGRVRELDSGHVLARPGQVYRIRLRNHGPLYCVAQVDIDGQHVTAGGLVLEPWGTTELERPVDSAEDGRFTVVAEGDESVFGPDGGRDDPKLGLVEAHFRRELPGYRHPEPPPVLMPWRTQPHGPPSPIPDISPLPDRFPVPPRVWPPLNELDRAHLALDAAFTARPSRVGPSAASIERAAGTGLTGHSAQQFVPFHLGPLEPEATVLRLRIVIGSEEALAEEPARPLGDRESAAPARPAARP